MVSFRRHKGKRVLKRCMLYPETAPTKLWDMMMTL